MHGASQKEFPGGVHMQNPPPGPPPGGQPPNYQPGGQQPGYPPQGQQPGYQQPGYQPAATGGIDRKTGAILAYVLGWVTGVIFLFVGKNDPDVKYHGAQSLVFFGGLSVLLAVLNIVGGFMPGVLKLLFGVVMFAIGLYGFVAWIICLVRASGGGGARFEVPLVGSYVTPYAEQIANAVN
jgi:uncharacterized membrane protein